MTLHRFVLRRLALMALTLLVVSFVIFLLAQVLPGNVGRTILGPYATNDQVSALNHELGYDRPVVIRYLSWLKGFVTGDWGDSVLLDVPVFPLVMDRLRNSFELAGVTLLLTVPTAIAVGVRAAMRQGGIFDRTISVVGLSLIAIPEFVSGVILLVFFAVYLNWFPISALAPSGSGAVERLQHLILPAIPLGFVLFGYIARMTRASTIDVLEAPYVRTAVLKGVTRRRLILRHVLRNALPPTVTVVALQVGFLASGLVVIETLFTYPGLGKLLLDSATGHDMPVLQASALFVGVIFMSLNLLADLLYGALNPRIRLGAAA